LEVGSIVFCFSQLIEIASQTYHSFGCLIPSPAQAEQADSSSGAEEGSEVEQHARKPAASVPARWSDAELRILEYYLPRYKTKTKVERKVLLSTKILPKLKDIFTEKDWKRRKQVFFLLTRHRYGILPVNSKCNIGITTMAAMR